ncbi:MAG: hypothetical protein LBF75_05680 [Treponema sp.]|jgi:hypothetical protein|nr:hypothetical protein [Treponema sp.]
MTVHEYTVSDEQGSTENKKGEIVAKQGDPFSFYVYNSNDSANPAIAVRIVMPLGGTESGLFRYPRVGEKVLVGTEESFHYLMGYIPTFTPSSQDFQTAGMSQEDGRGEVFRYRQTGKQEAKIGTEPYSEIGFYHRPTSWKAADGEKNDYADNNEYSYPKIDQLKIHSTGDIHESAVNHHRIKAKRFEILSNVDESDFSKDLKGGNRPFGDKRADVSELFQGDIHIRGKRRIVLKAGSEIRLEVGRSTIVISDAGIVLTTRKTHSDIHNSLDTVLSVLPRDGITMFGQHLKMAAVYDWAISENMGSSVKGTAGERVWQRL